ncbi:hypothetical protein I35_1833 [Burkholderia cenocepacia H111]|nr:hypothetical protein I35_1833 [Burkholderia cenocepacia H111]
MRRLHLFRPLPSTGGGSSSPTRSRRLARDLCKRRAIVRAIAVKPACTLAWRVSACSGWAAGTTPRAANSSVRLTSSIRRRDRRGPRASPAFRPQTPAFARRHAGDAWPDQRRTPRTRPSQLRETWRDTGETTVSRAPRAAMQCDLPERMCYKNSDIPAVRNRSRPCPTPSPRPSTPTVSSARSPGACPRRPIPRASCRRGNDRWSATVSTPLRRSARAC